MKQIKDKIKAKIGYIGINNPKINGPWVETDRVAREILKLPEMDLLFETMQMVGRFTNEDGDAKESARKELFRLWGKWCDLTRSTK